MVLRNFFENDFFFFFLLIVYFILENSIFGFWWGLCGSTSRGWSAKNIVIPNKNILNARFHNSLGPGPVGHPIDYHTCLFDFTVTFLYMFWFNLMVVVLSPPLIRDQNMVNISPINYYFWIRDIPNYYFLIWDIPN